MHDQISVTRKHIIDGRVVKYVTNVRSFDLILPDAETLAEPNDE